jgi:hypothetical protein
MGTYTQGIYIHMYKDRLTEIERILGEPKDTENVT